MESPKVSCICCDGDGNIMGRIWGTPGSPWGVRTCPACKGTGKVTEAEREKDKAFFESLPTEEEANESLRQSREGEEWKWGK